MEKRDIVLFSEKSLNDFFDSIAIYKNNKL